MEAPIKPTVAYVRSLSAIDLHKVPSEVERALGFAHDDVVETLHILITLHHKEEWAVANAISVQQKFFDAGESAWTGENLERYRKAKADNFDDVSWF